MRKWMKKLAAHYENARMRYPEDRLMILFDIDGTILDTRYIVLFVLRSYDNARGTQFFQDLTIDDITEHETEINNMLEEWKIPRESREDILDWYSRECWSKSAIMEAHRPFAGVMEVIRWFQIQPNTFVGLNTGRAEAVRAETLCSLNKIGEEYKVNFTSDLLYMNKMGWERDIPVSKVRGVHHYCRAGYRIFALVDNEPENLAAVAEVDPGRQILLLHADTIFKSKRKSLPADSVSGTGYDFSELIRNGGLPEHIQFVWHGVNDHNAVRMFLESNVRWAECDVRLDLSRTEVVCRRESFEDMELRPGEDLPAFREMLDLLLRSGRSMKIDVRENGRLLDRVIETVKLAGAPLSSLWFNSNIEVIGEEGFRKIAENFPGSVIQCPVDSLAPLILGMPAKALEFLDALQGWGINRFSLKWRTGCLHKVVEKLEQWGFNLNIYNVPDLESFLKAVLLMPQSITSDFNFRLHYLEQLQAEGITGTKNNIMSLSGVL